MRSGEGLAPAQGGYGWRNGRAGPSRLAEVSGRGPIAVADRIHAPHVSIGHDRDDTVLPFGESQRLFAAFRGRRGVTLTAFDLFQHADPTRRKLHKWTSIVELIEFGRFCWPAMRTPEAPTDPR